MEGTVEYKAEGKEGAASENRAHDTARLASRMNADPKAFVDLPRAEVAPYLAGYGFAAIDAKSWRPQEVAAPKLELAVNGHQELKGHTWYLMDCSLQIHGMKSLDFLAMHRLEQLRDELHARVKAEMGPSYAKHFGNTPFAQKGGLPGTTARLNAWFVTLAQVISACQCAPSLAAFVLRILDAPELDQDNIFASMPTLQVGDNSKPSLWESQFK